MTQSQPLRTETLLKQLTGSEDVRALFAPGRAVIGISEHAARLPQGQLILSFAVNLAARLFPVIQNLEVVVPPHIKTLARLPRWQSPMLDQHIDKLLSELNPPVRWAVAASHSHLQDNIVWIGQAPEGVKPTVFIGSDGWYAFVSPDEPMSVNATNPIGAYTAGCFAAAELWKGLLLPHRHLFENVPLAPCKSTMAFSARSRSQPRSQARIAV